MEKKDTGCDGFYLENGVCEAHGKVTVKDCKKCTCPSNKYQQKV